jgi:hypothetical protein
MLYAKRAPEKPSEAQFGGTSRSHLASVLHLACCFNQNTVYTYSIFIIVVFARNAIIFCDGGVSTLIDIR